MDLFWQDRQRSVWIRWVLGVWIGFTIAAGIKVLVQPTVHTVYPVFAEGARNWWQDVSLYAPSPDRDLFRYSPTFAVVMTPFAVWPHWLGGLLWLVANVLLLLVVLDRSAEEIFPGIDTPERKALWLLLTLAGSARSLWAGQSNSLVLVIAIAAMWAIGRRRWWLAAMLLAGGGFIKVWPWALALLVLVCWPRQLLLRIAATVVLWAALPFLTRPPEIVLWQYGEWFQMLHTTQIYRWGGYRDAWTIWDLIQFPVPQNTYELVQCESALAVLGWCLWQWGQLRPELGAQKTSLALSGFPGPGDGGSGTIALSARSLGPQGASGEDSARGFSRMAIGLLSAWAAWQLLFGPGSERLTYILIAPMSAWAVLASYRSGRYRWLAGTAWILISMFSMGAWERWVLRVTPWGRALLPLGVVIFVVWLVLHETAPGSLWRKTRLHQSPPRNPNPK